MNNDVIKGGADLERFDASDAIELGQWYWCRDEISDYSVPHLHALNCPDEDFPFLACVVHIGSNYVKLEHPERARNGCYTLRIHMNTFAANTIRQQEIDAYIVQNQNYWHDKHRETMGKITEMTKQIGVDADERAVGHSQDASAQALSVVSGSVDVDAYKNQLVQVKDIDLPAKIQELKDVSSNIAKWMGAGMLAVQSNFSHVNAHINARLFSISLYAGFNESAAKCQDGEPAPITEPLHVFQRMLYMDEECLLDYDAGGMEFKDIHEFDKWLCRDKNLNRLLPFPKCMLAMRVRRNPKDRCSELSPYVRFRLEQADKSTFLYFRNGDQVWWVETDIEFDEFLVPDEEPLHFGTDLMFKENGTEFMRVSEFEERKEKRKENKKLHKKWKKAHPDEDSWHSPYRRDSFGFTPSEWTPFNTDSVYFDDGWKRLSKEGEKHNKIGLILQGIIDRTEILQPFAPAKLWNGDDFAKHIKLIRDGRMTINDGDAPDAEAFIAKLNETLGVGSVTMGQSQYYDGKRPKNRCPYGDEGPGQIAVIREWMPRARKATYKWSRERQDYNDPRYGETYTRQGYCARR